MQPWSEETVARWERRSRRVLLVAGVLLLAAYLLPRPRIDGDGALTWMTPFERHDGWLGDFPLPPPLLVPLTLAFVGLGAWYLRAARIQPLARRGRAVAWASVALVLGLAARRAQSSWGSGGGGGELGWPWWDGSMALPALGLLLSRCAGQRGRGRALCVLGGVVGLAPVLLASAWNFDHLLWAELLASEEVAPRLFVLARALTLVASVALIWFGLGPRRARGRWIVATRLWIASLLVALLSGVIMYAEQGVPAGTRIGTALCVWFGFVLEVGRHLAPMAGLVVGLFLVLATGRRAVAPGTASTPET